MTKVHCDVCGESTAEEFADKAGFRRIRLTESCVDHNPNTMDNSTRTMEAHLCKKCVCGISFDDSLILMLKRNAAFDKHS